LIAQVLQEILRGTGIEIVLARQSIDRLRRRESRQIVHQPANREAELERPAGAIAFPERHLARFAGRRRHEHAVVRDLFDPPRRGAEDEGFADAAFEDHLFVQFADASGARAGTEQKDAEQAAVGDGAAIGNGHAFRTFARGDRAGHAIPRDARPQLREFVGRIPSRQHVEHAFEHGAAQLGERRRAPDGGKQMLDVPGVHGRHRHDLLREDIQGIAGVP